MSETSITFRCSEELKVLLGKQTVELDLTVSELIRACLVLGLPQVKFIQGLDRIKDKDIRPDFLDSK